MEVGLGGGEGECEKQRERGRKDEERDRKLNETDTDRGPASLLPDLGHVAACFTCSLPSVAFSSMADVARCSRARSYNLIQSLTPSSCFTGEV